MCLPVCSDDKIKLEEVDEEGYIKMKRYLLLLQISLTLAITANSQSVNWIALSLVVWQLTSATTSRQDPHAVAHLAANGKKKNPSHLRPGLSPFGGNSARRKRGPWRTAMPRSKKKARISDSVAGLRGLELPKDDFPKWRPVNRKKTSGNF